jgi:hypothetical protein
MKNKTLFLLFTLITALFLSCNPDDDDPSPVLPVEVDNQFKIGSTVYELDTGFRSASFPDNPGLFVTTVFLVDDGLSLDVASSQLVGTGNIIGLEFYTSGNNGLQAGVYNLDNVNDQPQTVTAYIGLDYNAQTDTAAVEDDVFQGSITVEALENGRFKISGQGRADDANATFTLSYTGDLLLSN